MPKYKDTNSRQGKFVSIYFEDQILPGTFEHTLSRLIDSDLDLAIFDERYKNDETGAPAYDPRIFLKIILFAYSRGITSSRRIARCCEENVIFMALSNDTRPHFTTIADFVAGMDKEILPFFRNVLMICDKMGLIGKEMFAIDGCKMPSNSSKQWSGTKANLDKKAAKMERVIKYILEKHRSQDNSGEEELNRDRQYVETLQEEVAKLRSKDWRWKMPLKNDHYTYRITWSEDDKEYVGLCAEFPSLSWLSKSPESALKGIRNVVAEVIKDMEKSGEEIPLPLATKNYSGKFMVRVPPEVHRDLAIQAAESGVSINRLVSSRLSH